MIFELTLDDPTETAEPTILLRDSIQASWVAQKEAADTQSETPLAEAAPFNCWVRPYGEETWEKFVCQPTLNWTAERAVEPAPEVE